MSRPVSNEVLKDRIDAIGIRISDLNIQAEVRRKETNERLDTVIDTMNRGYIPRVEYQAMVANNEKEHATFVPMNRYQTVERVVYGGVGFILLAFVTALALLVWPK